MVSLAVIGDIHGEMKRLGRVLEAIKKRDVAGILLVGDLGRNALFGMPEHWVPEQVAMYKESVEAVFSAVSSLGLPYAWVAGNHDHPEIEGAGCCDRRVVEIAGFRVYGIGGAGPQRFGFPYEWDEEEIEALKIPEVDILLCHAPPYGTSLDRLYHDGENVGSKAIRDHALAHKGFLLCGHIHESFGADTLGRCLCLNAGSLGAPYGRDIVGYLSRDEQGRHQVMLHLLATNEEKTWTL